MFILPLKVAIKILGIPYVVIKTTILYYTFGTVYTRPETVNTEFTHSLFKNVTLSVAVHVTRGLGPDVAKSLLNYPMQTHFKHYANSVLTLGLRNYGKRNDNYSYWVVQNEPESESAEKEDVLVYIHGGGYLLNMSESQFVSMLALYHALPEATQKRTSILLVDYSTTAENHTYPTQLWESVHAYDTLVKQGYKNIHLIGDSCGAHMACTVARYIAYPAEAQEQLKNFPKFDFGFHGPLVQPKSLILSSPWMAPCSRSRVPPIYGTNVAGDLGSEDTYLGDLYVGNIDRKLIENFLTYSKTNYDDHWAKVEPIVRGNVLMITGEREVLREHCCDFHAVINKHNNIPNYIEKGGIHASLVYVESLNYYGSKSAEKRAVNGDFKDRFSINLITDFLEKVQQS